MASLENLKYYPGTHYKLTQKGFDRFGHLLVLNDLLYIITNKPSLEFVLDFTDYLKHGAEPIFVEDDPVTRIFYVNSDGRLNKIIDTVTYCEEEFVCVKKSPLQQEVETLREQIITLNNQVAECRQEHADLKALIQSFTEL